MNGIIDFPTWQQRVDAQVRVELRVDDCESPEESLLTGFVGDADYREYFRRGWTVDDTARHIASIFIGGGWVC